MTTTLKKQILALKRSELTPKAIKSLICPAGKRQIYFRCFNDLHLFISVTPSGGKSFVYRRYLNKTWRELHISVFANVAEDHDARGIISQAVSRASEYNAAIERGENPFDKIKEFNAEPTLQELFDIYLERHIKKNGKRTDVIVKDFDRWFDKLARRKASSITRSDAEKFHGHINKERGPYSANRAIQQGRAIYFYAINKAKIFTGDNPFSGITLFDEDSRERFLSADEAARLIKALQDAPAEHCDFRTLRDFILLSMLIGVRKSCLFSLEWNEIDFKESVLTIPATKSKNKKGQTIPLGRSELTLLTERKQILKVANKEQADINFNRFVFPGKGETGHIVDLKNSWTTLRKNIQLSDITIHDLRRSLAAAMASQNVNVALIKGALNHKDMKTTLNVYARTNKQAELEARQLAHNSWFKAVDKLPEADNKVDISTAKKAR